MNTIYEALEHYKIEYEDIRGTLEINVLCPFHTDTQFGSAKINSDTGLFHCFACGEGMNLYQFVARLEDITPKEAIDFVDSGFEHKDRLSIERVKCKIKRVREGSNDKMQKLDNVKQEIVDHILTKLSIETQSVWFLARWITICTGVFSIPLTDKRELLQLYAVFNKERQKAVIERSITNASQPS